MIADMLILACPTIRYELEQSIKEQNSKARVEYLPQSLHSEPNKMHDYLQKKIDCMQGFERVVLCVSSCGGSTAGLMASTAEIILPRTRDCLDILLSGNSLAELKRDLGGVYYTKGWMDFSRQSEIDLDRLTKKLGRAEAEAYLCNLYRTCNRFYIIDTGCYDIEEVREYATPLVKLVNGSLDVIKGEYGILRKVAKRQFDEDFMVVEKGSRVITDGFLKNWQQDVNY